MASSPFDADDPVWRAALDWFLRSRHSPEDAQLQAELRAWLAADEDHRRAFEEAKTVWELSGRVAPAFRDRWPGKSHGGIVNGPHSATNSLSVVRRTVYSATAIAFAAAIAWLFLPALWLNMRADDATAVGERRTVDLEDGSLAHLNTQSAVRLHYTDRERRVGLLRGEVFFEVRPDDARPFIVEAEAVSVRVLGTKFNIRLEPASTTIAIASGRVSVGFEGRTAEFTAGQSVNVDIHTGRLARGAVAADRIGTWQKGQLIVDNRTIGEVVDEIRRYHRGIIMLDDELARKTISGVYNLNQPVDALVAAVQPHRGVIRSLTPYLLVISSR
jgi:transmembrane sensor